MSEVSAIPAKAAAAAIAPATPVDGAAFWAQIQAHSRVSPAAASAPAAGQLAQQRTIVSMIESMMQSELTSFVQSSQQSEQAKQLQSGDWGSFFANVVDRPLDPEADPTYAAILNLGQPGATAPDPQQAFERQMMTLVAGMSF